MPKLVASSAVAILLLAAGCTAGPARNPAGSSAADQPAASTNMAMPATPAMPAADARAPSRLVDPATFAAAVARPGTVTIDVHIPFEGKLPGTDLMIPYNEVAQRAAELPANRATTLAIYCRTGNMSAIAAPTLAALGYSHIVELKGGMQAWQASGRTLLMTP